MRYFIVIISLLVFGCSGKWHAQQAKRHELIAESKGIKISRDTVYKDVIKYIRLEGDDTTQQLAPVIDTTAFNNAMAANDSLVNLIDNLSGALFGGEFEGSDNTIIVTDKEKLMVQLQKARRDIKSLRSRIAQGFSSDSTYTLHPDSLTTIDIRIEKGLLKSAHYVRKETVLTIKERIPIELRKILELGYTYWQIIGFGIFLLIVGIMVGRITKRS